MIWFWYIPDKPNGYDFINTIGFGYSLVYNISNQINWKKPLKIKTYKCIYHRTTYDNLFVI